MAWHPQEARSKTVSEHYVYIMASRSRVLYTGMTSDLAQRVYAHKLKLAGGFTKAYNVTMLVYYEQTEDRRSAIGREKQIKGWLRRKKIDLIESMNPRWVDLSHGLLGNGDETLRCAQGGKGVIRVAGAAVHPRQYDHRP